VLEEMRLFEIVMFICMRALGHVSKGVVLTTKDSITKQACTKTEQNRSYTHSLLNLASTFYPLSSKS